ncbi:hypothetical protein LLG46_12035 [bacterium]|nr:hypothetical protein [bacterium]
MSASEPEHLRLTYPRVLSINSQPIGKNCATGLTMASLFRNWPSDHLAQIHLDEHDSSSMTCLKSSWQLRREHLRMPAVCKRIISEPCSSRVLRRVILALARYSSHELSAQMRKWISDFNPDVIYSALEDPYITRLVLDVSRQFSIPAVPHFMDDWMRTPFDRNQCTDPLRIRLVRDSLFLIRKSAVRMSIGAAMSKEYQRRYGRPFVPFMCCVDTHTHPVYPNPSVRSPMVFAYIGGLHLGRVSPLLDIAEALMDLGSQGFMGEIVIYAQDGRGAIDPCLLNHPAVRPASIDEIKLKNTSHTPIDCLIHVESFEPDIIEYTRYSMSSKLPWMMATGIPIFAYGPVEASTMEYIKSHGCGMAIDRRDSALLTCGLRRLMTDTDLRASLGARGRQVAEANHEVSIVCESFRRSLVNAASSAIVDNKATARHALF